MGSPLTRSPVPESVVRFLRVRGILRVLGLMKRDRMNYTIQSLQPHLQEHSVQYERAKFQELLNKQPSMYKTPGHAWGDMTLGLTFVTPESTLPPFRKASSVGGGRGNSYLR